MVDPIHGMTRELKLWKQKAGDRNVQNLTCSNLKAESAGGERANNLRLIQEMVN